MFKDDALVLSKAKDTFYNHSKWFTAGDKTVYEVMSYMVNSGDFCIDIVNTLTSVGMIPNYHGKTPCTDKKEVINYLLQENLYDYLVIRCNGKEKGTDRGKLKIQTFLILQEQNKKEKKGNIKLTRYELSYCDEPQGVGFLTGLGDIGMSGKRVSNLLKNLDLNLVRPNILVPNTKCYFTAEGIETFKEDIKKIKRAIKETNELWDLVKIDLFIPANSNRIVYQDVHQIVLKNN